MNPLELRKVIQVGYRFDNPDGAKPILGGDGQPAKLVSTRWWATFVFWIPQKPPFRRCAGDTKVIDARPFELQALRDGAIKEYRHEFEFPSQPPAEKLGPFLVQVWEAFTLDDLGYLPNGAPLDRSGKIAMQFTAIEKPRLQ